MNAVADFLIAVLEDFKTFGLANQVMFLGFALSVLFAPFAALWGWMKRRQGHLAGELLACRQARGGAERRVATLEAEKSKLAEQAPATVLRRFEIERRDNNRGRLVATADCYMTHHRASFAEACRILAEHHLSRWEDGADALHRARTAAMGAVAAAIDGSELELLLDEIERLQRVETAPPETREEIRQREERDRLRRLLRATPGDVKALRKIGQKEFDAGRYRIAIVLFERAQEALMAQGAAISGVRQLSIQRSLGWATLYAGRLRAARKIIGPLPELSANATSPSDPVTLDSRELVGKLLWYEGAFTAAENELCDLLMLRVKVKGEEHPDTLNTRYGLAQAILGQGRAVEAEQVFRELLRLREKVLGREHPATLSTRHELARAILDQGRAAEAEAALRDLLPLATRVQGAEHPYTLTTRSVLARAILDQGRAAEAEAALHDLIPRETKVQGAEHPHTLTTRYCLARAILDQGRTAEAEQAFRDLLPVEAKVKGAEHSDTLATQYMLARVILDQGRAAEAERAFMDLQHVEVKVKGDEHPDTLATRRALAQAALEQGSSDRARDALASLPEDGGDPDPLAKGRTAMLRGWLADLDGAAARAEALLDEAEAHLAHLAADQFARRELARYRDTRVPGAAGGTMVLPADEA
jgi:hypothetical protein